LGGQSARRWDAVLWLLLTTPGWGLSFPVVKAIALLQAQAVPGASSWFYAANSLAARFAGASLLVLILCGRQLKFFTGSETRQGAVLGILAGGGMLLQYDGLSYTSASVSAFLTQFYVVLIPLFLALWERRAPSPRLLMAVALVVMGVALLADVGLRDLRLGRGEAETLLSTVFFAAQILYLQKPEFRDHNALRVTLAMFATIAVVMAIIAIYHAPQTRDLLTAMQALPVLQLLAFLIVASTVLPFVIMNAWQKHVGASEASLIYSTEPVVTGLAVLALPGWMSAMWGIEYSNESFTLSLLCGGALILAANVLAQWPEKKSGDAQGAKDAQSAQNA
jgi:drug/metabolite transporter (DMT)-like permease